jgi:DNA-binding transcriptional regulator GbsR (MarR family)
MEKIEEEIKNIFCGTASMMGLKEPVIKVIAHLYLEPEEIAMDELAKKTGYSLASVSNIMAMLENFNLAKRIKKPGTKKVFFFMEKNLAKLNIQKLKNVSIYIKCMGERMPAVLEKYRKKAKSDYEKKKLKIAENYYTQLQEIEKYLNNWQKDLEKLSKKNVM